MDWHGLMLRGLRDLGLCPRDFWALTPIELLVMLGMEEAPVPLTRARLHELDRRYGNVTKGQTDGKCG